MATGHFLIRNRHNNNWYGRVVIPQSLRSHFNDRRELRLSLNTQNKQAAKRHSRSFWLHCQSGFDRLQQHPDRQKSFQQTREFLAWLSQKPVQGYEHKDMAYYIETFDVFGKKHVIDLDDPEQEKTFALQLQENAVKLLDRYKNNPEILDRILNIGNTEFSQPDNQPESPTSFHEAVDLYIDKLATQGRKGKQLAPRTLLTYKDKLLFWQSYFGQRQVHTLTLKELGEIQNWLPSLASNLNKKGINIDRAVTLAQHKSNRYPIISGKTRAEYVGQLKGLLEYCYNSGFITANMASHIELPNTKLSRSIWRLPFLTEDLQKIFPGEAYGEKFGIQTTGLDKECKFWFPLLAVFTGARLEELGQLQTDDIRTCPDTGIVYAMIDNQGVTADGTKKRTKNLNSVRPIPIHSTLITIGFLDFVEKRKTDKRDKGLFKLKRDKQGRLARGISGWFTRNDKRKNGNPVLGYIERCGVTSKGDNAAGERWTKSFHSFRHTVIDNLRGKQLANGEYIREQDIALVVGHEKNKLETASYGVDRSQLELRKAVIEAIEYPNVAFNDIAWK